MCPWTGVKKGGSVYLADVACEEEAKDLTHPDAIQATRKSAGDIGLLCMQFFFF